MYTYASDFHLHSKKGVSNSWNISQTHVAISQYERPAPQTSLQSASAPACVLPVPMSRPLCVLL